MTNVQRAIIPGFIAGCIFLIYFTTLLTDPARVLALASLKNLAAADLSVGTGVGRLIVSQSPTPALPSPPAAEAIAESAAIEAQPDLNTVAASAPSCAISAAYPEKIQQWCAPVSAAAAQYSIDANLIAAVMLQESGGDSQAYSKSGAVGLMQVMPRDGLAASFMCKNGPCFAARPGMDELYNPEFNIDYGARMLAGLINRSGDVREALRSYGPMDMGYRYADIVLGHYSRYQP